MTVEEKKQLRQLMHARRAEVHARHGEAAGEAIRTHGLELLARSAPTVISGYWPYRSELNPRPLLAALTGQDWTVVLPTVPERDALLVFRAWHPGDALEPGFNNIPEPPATSGIHEPQVMLMPLLAFDAEGYRLGYGGGFYDRKLERLRADGSVITVGLAYDEQEVVMVPREAHDQQLDWILTPSGARLLKA